MFPCMGGGDAVWSSDSSAVRAGWSYFPAQGVKDVARTSYSKFSCKNKVTFIKVHRCHVKKTVLEIQTPKDTCLRV